MSTEIFADAHCYKQRNIIYFQPYFKNNINNVIIDNLGKNKKHEVLL